VSEPDKPDARKSLFTRIVERLSEISGYVSGVLILASMLVVCYGVLLRYFLGASTIWQTELAIYFLMFAAFVGGAYGLKHGDHVRIDLVVNRFSGRTRTLINLVAALLGLSLIVVVGVIGLVLWWETTVAGRRSGTAWNPPLTYPYFIVPLGMGLISLQYLVIAAELFQKLRTGDTEDRTPDEAEEVLEDGRQL
jgi:TRAP-type C4-dicarboxylate transport system permease small subunit